MKTPRLLPAVWFFALIFPAAPLSFAQGDLNPPPGPPAPTMKSLDQVEPRTIVNGTNCPGDATNTFIISAPGSYYLTGNITGGAGQHGISIQASDVTLDLNGFALISGGGGASRGVDVPAVQTNLCIRNGSVQGWGGDGIHGQAAVMLAERLRVSDCRNPPTNTASGLAVGNGSIIRDCVATNNIVGFYAPDRTQVTNCIATLNDVGFSCTSYVTLLDCTASRGGTGILVQGSSSVIRCTATRNDFDGIDAGPGCTVADCTAGANGYEGILSDYGTTVRNCTAQANNIGIYCGASCHVTGNTCDGNAGGIYSGSNGSRIEGNNCTGNTVGGYSITGHNNLFIRNSAHGNATNFAIGIQAAGPIVDMTGGGTISNTIPSANFSY